LSPANRATLPLSGRIPERNTRPNDISKSGQTMPQATKTATNFADSDDTMDGVRGFFDGNDREK
jgi:hypothetical protein